MDTLVQAFIFTPSYLSPHLIYFSLFLLTQILFSLFTHCFSHLFKYILSVSESEIVSPERDVIHYLFEIRDYFLNNYLQNLSLVSNTDPSSRKIKEERNKFYFFKKALIFKSSRFFWAFVSH